MKNLSSLIDEGSRIRQNMPEKALDIFTEVLNESELISNEEFRTISLFNIAITYLILGNYKRSISYFQDALNTDYALNNRELQAEILRGIAGNHSKIYNYREALKYFYMAEEASLKCGHMQNLHMVLLGISSLYTKIHLNEKALDYALRSLEISKQNENNDPLQASLMAIGACYYKTGNTAEAKKYFEESLGLSANQFAEANALHFISSMKFDEKDHASAEELAERQIKISSEYNYYDFEALGLRLLGNIRFNEEKFTDALGYYEKAVKVLNSVGDRSIKFALQKNILDTYEKLGQKDKMLNLYEKLYKDHINHLENDIQLKIEQLNIETDTEKIKKEVEKEKENNQRLSKALNEVHMLNDELKMMHNEKNNLMGILAHDLKNPLQSILSSVRLMRSETEDKSFRDEMAVNIKEQSGRMLNLINRMLDYRSIECGSIKMNKTDFLISELTSKIIKQASIQAVKKDINIINECTCSGSKLHTDYELLYQVLENLLSNAIKFSEPGTNIYLKCLCTADTSILEIEDQGPGFSDEDLKKLYSNFSKLSAKPTGNEHSTGLGLSIVKKLCDLLGAEISLHSQLNSGSKFILKFKNK